MGLDEFLRSNTMSFFQNLLSSGLGAEALNYLATDELKDLVGRQIEGVEGRRQAILDDATSRGQFQPFTVTSTLASAPTDDTGGFSVNLTPDQETLQDTLMTQAAGAFGEIGADRATREQEIFDRLQALRQPEQERSRLALQNRLFNEGRQGLISDQYGGTPEGLQFEKAIQEQLAADSLTAMTQAGQERQQALALGSGLLGQGYVPQQQALNMLELGGQIARLPTAVQQDYYGGAINTGREGMEDIFGLQTEISDIEKRRLDNIRDLLVSQAQQQSGIFSGGLLTSIGGGVGGIIDDIIGAIF